MVKIVTKKLFHFASLVLYEISMHLKMIFTFVFDLHNNKRFIISKYCITLFNICDAAFSSLPVSLVFTVSIVATAEVVTRVRGGCRFFCSEFGNRIRSEERFMCFNHV